MATEHGSIQHADCHEPRHITTSGALDAGKVITPSATSPGTSVLRQLDLAELLDAGFLLQAPVYGGKTIKNNATLIAKTAAVDATLVTASDYSQVTGIWEADIAPISGMTRQLTTLTVLTTGVYSIDFWADVSSSVASTEVGFNYGIAGVPSVERPVIIHLVGINDRSSLAAHTHIQLDAGSVVSLWLASTTTANIRVLHSRLSLTLLKRTA